MFILTKIADLVQITPEDFSKAASQAIEDNLNAKYANQVIQKIGLCVCLYDLLSASEGLIGHGTGLVNVNVEFRLVVFRPFKDEVLLGRISSATPAGLRIRTQFFEDIYVPADKLPEGAHFSHDEQLFIWNPPADPAELSNNIDTSGPSSPIYPPPEPASPSTTTHHTQRPSFDSPTYDPPSDDPPSEPLYYDNQETVRFRIIAETWKDQIPVGPKERSGGGGGANGSANGSGGRAGLGGVGGLDDGAAPAMVPVVVGGTSVMVNSRSPYSLIGSMADAGLGPCLWWDGEE